MPEPLLMSPAPGERKLAFVGDRVTFGLRAGSSEEATKGWRAFLRATLGRGSILRQEIIHAKTGHLALARSAWRDIPMDFKDGQWHREITLSEVGYFRAKAYAVD